MLVKRIISAIAIASLVVLPLVGCHSDGGGVDAPLVKNPPPPPPRPDKPDLKPSAGGGGGG